MDVLDGTKGVVVLDNKLLRLTEGESKMLKRWVPIMLGVM